MKIVTKLALTFILCGVIARLQAQTNTPPTDLELKDAAQTMLVKGLDDTALDLMRLCAGNALAEPYLRSRAMAVYAFSSLVRGDANMFERVRMAHRSAYPAERDLIPSQQISKESAIASLKSALGEIITYVERSRRLNAEVAVAHAEKDPVRRIELCRALLKELKEGELQKEVEELLQAAIAQQRQKEQEERNAQLAQAIELERLREFERSSEPLAALRTMQDYLRDNPDTPHRLEAQRIINTLTVIVENKRKRERLWWWLGGGVLLLATLSSLRINFFKYNVYSHAKRVPADERVTKVDVNKLTDPHSLNAREHD